jgi:hypothetical protein
MKKPQKSLKLFIKITALISLFVTIIGYTTHENNWWFWGLMPLAILILAAVNPCKNCYAWRSQRKIRCKKIDDYTDYRTVNKTREIRDSKGMLIRTEHYTEKEPVHVEIFDVVYKCRFCDNTYTKRRKIET